MRCARGSDPGMRRFSLFGKCFVTFTGVMGLSARNVFDTQLVLCLVKIGPAA